MNKRIKKKLGKREYYSKYKNYKKNSAKPWKNFLLENKRREKRGLPTRDFETICKLIYFGIYTEKEAKEYERVIWGE